MTITRLTFRFVFVNIAILAVSHLLTGCMSAHNIRQPDQLVSTARPITVMTYNIRIGAGRDNPKRNLYKLKDEKTLNLAPVIQAIRSVDPDIIGLQEVLGERQTSELGRVLNMNYAYVPYGMDKFDSWWGMAILSKFPIQKISIQHITFGIKRSNSNLVATLTLLGNKTTLFCMHKSPYLTDGNTFRITMERITKIPEPVILLGDLNILPGDTRADNLFGHFEDTALVRTKTAEFARKKGTYLGESGNLRGKRIDYILVEKNRFEVLDAGIIEQKHWPASDHAGYYATIKFKHE